MHRHLDGSVRLETILDLARQHGLQLNGVRAAFLSAEEKDEMLARVVARGPVQEL